jgi:hypothetical protein
MIDGSILLAMADKFSWAQEGMVAEMKYRKMTQTMRKRNKIISLPPEY